MTKEKLKLNLGSRDREIYGFVGMDCDSHPGVNLVGDISDLSRFKDGEVSEIYCSHAFEHFPHTQADKVLAEWARVLEPGGTLYIAVPDFARCVELYAHVGLNDWINRFLMGDQIYKTAFHYSLFDEAKLMGMLKKAGFSDAHRVEEFPVGHQSDCSRLKSNLDGQSVSLNIMAIK